MTPLPLISIIVCTCNRAEHLRLTLQSLGQICVPQGLQAELIVVDNASTDDTAQVVQECLLPTMPVRYIYEPRQGKGFAYNRGMAEAVGQILLFTDDDLRFPKDWLTEMAEPILFRKADAVAGGVRMAAELERPWMWAGLRGAMADTTHLSAEAPQNMVGANMAFSRAVLNKVPAFDTELGPGALGFADEVLFSYQLKAAGFSLVSALDVVVEHHFDPSRLSHASLLQAAEKHGCSVAYIVYHWSHTRLRMPRVRLAAYKLRLACQRALHRREATRTEGVAKWEFEDVTRIAFYRAYLGEHLRPRLYEKQGLAKRKPELRQT